MLFDNVLDTVWSQRKGWCSNKLCNPRLLYLNIAQQLCPSLLNRNQNLSLKKSWFSANSLKWHLFMYKMYWNPQEPMQNHPIRKLWHIWNVHVPKKLKLEKLQRLCLHWFLTLLLKSCKSLNEIRITSPALLLYYCYTVIRNLTVFVIVNAALSLWIQNSTCSSLSL